MDPTQNSQKNITVENANSNNSNIQLSIGQEKEKEKANVITRKNKCSKRVIIGIIVISCILFLGAISITLIVKYCRKKVDEENNETPEPNNNGTKTTNEKDSSIEKKEKREKKDEIIGNRQNQTLKLKFYQRKMFPPNYQGLRRNEVYSYFNIFSESYKGLSKDNSEIYVQGKKIEFSKHVYIMEKDFSPDDIINVEIKFKENLTSLEDMFKDVTELREVDFSSVVTSEITTMNRAFSGCSSLSLIDLSSFDTKKVISMEGMFSSCTKLTSINLSGLNTSKLENINNMFQSCIHLKNLDLSSFDLTKIKNMSHVFDGCNFESVNLKNFNMSNVKEEEIIDIFGKTIKEFTKMIDNGVIKSEHMTIKLSYISKNQKKKKYESQ